MVALLIYVNQLYVEGIGESDIESVVCGEYVAKKKKMYMLLDKNYKENCVQHGIGNSL